MVYNAQQNIKRYYEKNLRLDGRKKNEIRELKIEYGVSKNAEGSAKVTLGDTIVFAGVKMAIEQPYDDTPDQGNLMVNAELTPMGNPEFEMGPPSDWAIEISRVVDRTIREGKAVDLKKLCIEKGEKVWSVMIDLVPINDAGNLLDACSIAAIAALQDAKFPVIEEGKINYKKHDKKLELERKPLLVTVYKIADELVVDPDYEEEEGIEARISIGILENGELCALQKGGNDYFTKEEILEAVKLAKKTAEEYRKKL